MDIHSISLKLECIMVEKLGKFWNYKQLPGVYWRLYHNDSDGAGLILQDNKRLPMSPKKIYIVPPNAICGSFSEQEPNQLYIHFDLQNCKKQSEAVFELSLDDDLWKLLNSTHALYNKNKNQIELQFTALALVAMALAKLPPECLPLERTDERISQACEMLKAHPEFFWTNGILAKKFNMATNSFSRLFKEVKDVTPYNYLQNIRYSLAIELLENPALTIGEICSRIGINDLCHFSRVFKRYYGRSPRDYRNFIISNKKGK